MVLHSHAYIVIAHKVMAYVIMASAIMGYVVMAYIGPSLRAVRPELLGVGEHVQPLVEACVVCAINCSIKTAALQQGHGNSIALGSPINRIAFTDRVVVQSLDLSAP